MIADQFVLINKVTWVIDEVSAVVVSDISEDRKTGVIEAPQSSDLDESHQGLEAPELAREGLILKKSFHVTIFTVDNF